MIRDFLHFLKQKLQGRTTLQKIIQNSGWLLADKLIRLGIGLTVSVWIARYLGPDQFGLFNFATALVGIFAPFAALGLDGIVVRNLVRTPENRDELLATTFLLKLLGAIFLIAFVVVTAMLIRPNEHLVVLLIGITAFGTFSQAVDVCDLWFQSRMESRYTVLAKTAAFLLFAGVKISLILSAQPLLAFAWAATGELLVSALFLLMVFTRRSGRIRLRAAKPACARQLMLESWPLFLSGLAVTLYMRVDMVMLGEILGDREVGVYAAATRISEAWYFMPLAVATSTFPVIVRSRDTDPGLYLSRIQRLYHFMAWLGIGIALPLSMLSDWLVDLLYGDSYQASAGVLAVHLWASIPVFLGVASGQYLLAEHLQRISLYRTAIGLGCNIALNLALIPPFGAFGAAVATVLSYFAATFSLVFFSSTRSHTIRLLLAPFLRG